MWITDKYHNTKRSIKDDNFFKEQLHLRQFICTFKKFETKDEQVLNSSFVAIFFFFRLWSAFNYCTIKLVIINNNK